MRLILLALLTALVVMPQAADAARRDDRSGPTASRSASAATPAARTASRATPRPAANRTAARTTTRTPARTTARNTARPAATRNAARGTSRNTARATTRSAARNTARATPNRNATRTNRTASRQAAVQRGDVRTQRQNLVVRGAQAATISRGGMRSTPRGSIAGWQAGLPAMTMAQRDCPAGTFATLARGHSDIVRCMPL